MEHQNTVEWNVKDGTITLHNSKDHHRLLLKRYDFVFSFVEEMNRVMGNVPVMMVFRKVLEKCGAPHKFLEQVTVENTGVFVDGLIVPVDVDNSVIPDAISWDGKSRTLDFLGGTHWRVLPVSFIRCFRDALYETLTVNGTKAIVREATKRAGMAMAEQAVKAYRWKTMEDLIDHQDEEIYLGTFTHAGWSYSRVFSRQEADDNHLFLAKISNSYESDGVSGRDRPICDWLMSYMDGFYNGVVNMLTGKFVETREVRCRAMGDPYCAFAHKIKNNKKDILDWKEVEGSWKELDAIPLPPAA
jgi:predicted hydrocarbon binding protein